MVHLRQNVGAALRRTPPSARLLTEWQLRRLRHLATQPEFAWTTSFAERGSTAIDVGASVGNYALGLSHAVGARGRVVALEPNPLVYRQLVRSVWLSNVEPLPCAAGAATGMADLYVPRNGGGTPVAPLGSLANRPATDFELVRVRVVPLDDLDIRGSVSVIKIDAEGYELDVVRGGTSLLAKHRPTLVVEIEERHLEGRSVNAVVGEICDLGYRCCPIGATGLMDWAQFDIERHQLSHVAPDGSLMPEQVGDYVNNFVFLRLEG